MAKGLKRTAQRLESEAGHRAEAIRRVVREYNEAFQSGEISPAARHMKQREIEREVRNFMRLQKALKRLGREARANK